MVGIDDMAPTSLSEGRGSRWLDGSRRGGVTWQDLKKVQLGRNQTHMFAHMTHGLSRTFRLLFVICNV